MYMKFVLYIICIAMIVNIIMNKEYCMIIVYYMYMNMIIV